MSNEKSVADAFPDFVTEVENPIASEVESVWRLYGSLKKSFSMKANELAENRREL